MPLPTFYATGSASVVNDEVMITFVGALLGTAEFPTVQAGDLFCDPAQPLVPPQRIAAVDYVAATAALAVGWPGTTMTADPYEVRFVGDPVRSTAQTRRLLEQFSVVQATASNLFYIFDDTTSDGDPGAGRFRINNLAIGASTQGYLDDLDAKGATVGSVVRTWDDGGSAAQRGQLWVRSVVSPATFACLNVAGSILDGSGYSKVSWSYVGGSGSFVAGDELMVFFSPAGAGLTAQPRGDWNGVITYGLLDLVVFGGYTFLSAEAGNLDNQPVVSPGPASDAHWTYIPLPSAGDLIDIAFWAEGLFTDGQTLQALVFVGTAFFPTNLPGSEVVIGTAPNDDAVISIQKNGLEIGTISFGAASATAVLDFPDDTTFVAGDVMKFVAPNPSDSALADLSVTLRGTRDASLAIDQSGIAVLDFGAEPGTTDASLVVTGIGRMKADSVIRCWVWAGGAGTADHSEDEHKVADLILTAGEVTAGVGFTIFAQVRGEDSYAGQWNIAWEWF